MTTTIITIITLSTLTPMSIPTSTPAMSRAVSIHSGCRARALGALPTLRTKNARPRRGPGETGWVCPTEF